MPIRQKLLMIMTTAAAIILVFVGLAMSAPKPEVLKIGMLAGLTGPGSQMQMAARDFTLMCQDWINREGGITIKGKKYQIQCIVEDTKSSTAGSVTAATKLIFQDQVKFIIGGFVPVMVDAVAAVTEQNKVLYVASMSDVVHPDRLLSFVGNYSYASPLAGLYDAMLRLYPRVKVIGYIVEDEPGARAVANLSQNIAKARGLEVLEQQLHPWESTEYYPEWTKVLSQKPDAVDNGLKMPNNTAACVKQGREQGFKGPMFASISGDPRLLLNMIGKDLATDFLWASLDVYGPAAPPKMKEIVKLWSDTHKQPCDLDGVSAWDLLWVLAQAIEKAQSLDPVEVAKTFEKTDTFDTSRGTAKMGGAKTFGINHMVFRPCPVSRLKNGKIEFIRWYDTWVP
jgi:branched-chain amino acid transport system substrate-binding protein